MSLHFPKSGNYFVDIFTSATFQEDEVKLDAPNADLIDQIWWDVISDTDHFSPSFHKHTGSNKLDEVNWSSLSHAQHATPREVSKLRYRYYYDTRLQSLFNDKVELRIEPKGGAFKQVIKIGNCASEERPVMKRPEYPAQLRASRARISAIDKNVDKRQETIDFLKRSVHKAGAIKPVIAIESGRRKLEYHPDGDKNVTIEFAADIATGINTKGFLWPLYQIELEIKENKSDKTNEANIIGRA